MDDSPTDCPSPILDDFRRPPEAPVFEPSDEDFRDPIAYINKIKPIAEKSGICRIRPPADWQPPFAVDINKFKFVPRVQNLNELEAITRIKLNFAEQVVTFWELQGIKVKIPMYEGRTLDIYSLHRFVTSEGGWDVVSSEKKWGKIARKLKLVNARAMSSVLKYNYEKILKPFDFYQRISKSKKYMKRQDEVIEISDEESEGEPFCQGCMSLDEGTEKTVVCVNCLERYHRICLPIPMPFNFKRDWRCPKCVVNEVRNIDPFGFEESKKEYTLVEFGEMADEFKTSYFRKPAHMVPLREVEYEFWKIVSSLDETVTVEYGSDLHSVERGSGFPTLDTIDRSKNNPDILKYVKSPWNLNNFPILEGSVFSHINGRISGVKTPWMYVGMCFSTFCWHIEDHWSYSINYLHWGEPKTWYGVPGYYAEEFEATMKKVAPELFTMQPDLLHQLTTMLNPAVLMNDGVPVFRTDQKAGEFVITFPRAYHSGFNQGYNCAEAVNFAPADWLSLGRECISHYSQIQRNCVFSHDELVCKIALDAANIDPRIAAATYYDMFQMVKKEQELRKKVADWGVKHVQKILFEQVPDEERQCDYCKSIIYVSAIKCKCSDKIVCLPHFDQLCSVCDPVNHVLKYRFSLSEMPVLLHKLKLKAESFDYWLGTVKNLLLSDSLSTPNIIELKQLIAEAKEKRLPVDVISQLLDARRVANKRKNSSPGQPVIKTIALSPPESSSSNSTPDSPSTPEMDVSPVASEMLDSSEESDVSMAYDDDHLAIPSTSNGVPSANRYPMVVVDLTQLPSKPGPSSSKLKILPSTSKFSPQPSTSRVLGPAKFTPTPSTSKFSPQPSTSRVLGPAKFTPTPSTSKYSPIPSTSGVKRKIIVPLQKRKSLPLPVLTPLRKFLPHMETIVID